MFLRPKPVSRLPAVKPRAEIQPFWSKFRFENKRTQTFYSHVSLARRFFSNEKKSVSLEYLLEIGKISTEIYLEAKKAESKKAEAESKKAEADIKMAEIKMAEIKMAEEKAEATIKKDEPESNTKFTMINLPKISEDELFKKLDAAFLKASEFLEIPSLRKMKLESGKETDLPCFITRSEFDARFLSGNMTQEDQLSDVAKKVISVMASNLENSEFPSMHLLLGPTGCGKTKAAFDIARRQYSIYLDIPNLVQLNSTHAEDLQRTFPAYIATKILRTEDPDEWRTNGPLCIDYCVRRLLLCRLYALSMFLEHKKISPEQWLLLQLKQNWVKPIIDILFEFEPIDVDLAIAFNRVWEKLRKHSVFQVPVILDEVQVLLGEKKGVFASKVAIEGRPYLSPYMDAFNKYRAIPIVVAGTNLELAAPDIFFSAVAKTDFEMGQLLYTHTEFVCTTAEECSTFLGYLFTKAKLPATETELKIAGSWLQGRLRWATKFVYNRLKNPTQPFLEVLEAHFRRTATNGKDDKNGFQYLIGRYVSNHGKNLSYLSELLASYTRKDVILKSGIPADYIQPGLGFLRDPESPQKEKEKEYLWICTEPMAAVAIRHFFETRASPYEMLANVAVKHFAITEVSSKERGFQLERLIAMGFAFNCLGKPLSSLYEDNISNMPDWFRNNTFVFSSEFIQGWTNQELKEKLTHWEEPVVPRSLEEYLGSKDAHSIFLPPADKSHPLRPDVAVLLTDYLDPYQATVQSIAKNRNPTILPPKKVLILVSVKTSRNRIGVGATKSALDMTKMEKKSIVGLVRIHVFLPYSTREAGGMKKINDSEVVINIDQSNLHKFLPLKGRTARLLKGNYGKSKGPYCRLAGPNLFLQIKRHVS